MGIENVSQSMNRLLRSFIGTVCVSDSTSVVERFLRVSTLIWHTVQYITTEH
jgi:hypothetical protein